MSEQRPKRSPAEAWEAIQKSKLRREGERVAKMSREELDASLAARGVDAGAARERGAALAAKLMAQRAAPAPAPEVISLTAERAKRRPAWLLPLVAAAALVVLVGGGGAVVAVNWPSPSATPSAPPGPSPEQLAQERRAKAEDLRRIAAVKCGAEDWDACRERLGDASKLDPMGSDTRAVRRLDTMAARGIAQRELEAKQVPSPRSIAPDAEAAFVAALAGAKGQALRLVCARSAEPAALCDQLALGLRRAGWTVTRADVVPDGGGPHGILLEVATDADDATQAAADALSTALERAFLFARGPSDAPPGGDAALRLTVGRQ